MKNQKFYNADIKEEYFNTFQNKATQEITEYAFKKAKNTEELLGKDIFDMNINELGNLIKGLSASTVDSAYNYAFKFQYYIDWASKNGYRKTNINPLDIIEDKKEWVKPFVARYKQSIFTREEILDMCEKLANYPDRAILLGLFEGISGEGYSELLNLRTKDLSEKDGKFFATLHNKNGEIRTIQISEKLHYYLHKADEATVYYNKNGESESVRSSESILVESPYIFKKSARGKQEGKLDLFFVNRKFQMYKDLFGAEFLRAKEVANSGILHMVNEFYKEKHVIEESDWNEIAEQYDAIFIEYKGKKTRNTNAIKEKANSQIFEEKYGYKVNELV